MTKLTLSLRLQRDDFALYKLLTDRWILRQRKQKLQAYEAARSCAQPKNQRNINTFGKKS